MLASSTVEFIGQGLQRVNPLTESGWDRLILSHPEHCCFHGAAWARVLGRTYHHQPYYFAVRHADRLEALLPVMEVNSPITGRRGVSLPFTDECPVIASESVPSNTLFDEAIEFGCRRRWRYLELRSRLPGMDAPPSLSFRAHELDLSRGKSRVFERFDGSVRRAIRKSESAGVKVEVSRDLAAVHAFYQLHCKTRRRHGLPPQPYAFFLNILHEILVQNLGFVVLTRYREKPIAAAMFFHLGAKAIYKFGASDMSFQHLRANDLVMWRAIQWYAENGFESLHFGRTSLNNEGLRRFKLGFGPQERKVDYFKYSFRREAFVVDIDRSSNVLNRVFRLLPVPILRIVGSVLYKHWS